MKGIFFSFEGIEGTGKSTQAGLLAAYLRGKGLSVLLTAEPGGASISRKIREILLSPDSHGMDAVTELLLYNAARVQHIREIIMPALSRGDIVITDRFSDSTVAYQGYGRGIDPKIIDALDAIATDRLRPDITLLLDVEVRTGLKRNRDIQKNDRLEQEDVAFHELVRRGFIQMAAHEPDRIKLIDCSGDIKDIHKRIVSVVETFLGARTRSA